MTFKKTIEHPMHIEIYTFLCFEIEENRLCFFED